MLISGKTKMITIINPTNNVVVLPAKTKLGKAEPVGYKEIEMAEKEELPVNNVKTTGMDTSLIDINPEISTEDKKKIEEVILKNKDAFSWNGE